MYTHTIEPARSQTRGQLVRVNQGNRFLRYLIPGPTEAVNSVIFSPGQNLLVSAASE